MTFAPTPLPRGIVSVVQTPFDAHGEVDSGSLERLVQDAVQGGVAGLLAPVVASETAYLSAAEREAVIRRIVETIGGRVPLIVGASSDAPEVCRTMAGLAEAVGAAAYLVAVPAAGYAAPECIVDFFRNATAGSRLPLVVQDFQWGGPGLDLATIRRLSDALPTLAGLKIETLPAGPKYTAVREALGSGFYIAGGWAVMQMIEALDRGVDAMMPESAMVRVYAAIYARYVAGNRRAAQELFRRLLPVLAFTNQDVVTSVAFFKRLLVRKGIFKTGVARMPGFTWDRYNGRIAEELIGDYLQLERDVASWKCPGS